MTSFSSSFRSGIQLCLWLVLAMAAQMEVGASFISYGLRRSFVPDWFWYGPVSNWPLDKAVLNLPVAEGAQVEMNAVETAPFLVTAMGTTPYWEVKSYSWSSTHATRYKTSDSAGEVYLEWFYEGKLIGDFAEWITDGNPGKGGRYTVKLRQSEGFKRTAPPTSTLAERTFHVVIAGHTPLEAGAPPVFVSVPDLGEVTKIPYEGQLLQVEANAGGTFVFKWFRDGVFFSSKKDLRVHLADLGGKKRCLFHCVVSGPTGQAETRAYALEEGTAPRVDFTKSVAVTSEGGTLSLVPQAVSDTPMTFLWDGPALAAGGDRAQVLEDGTLEIKNARMEDAGAYTFSVTNTEIRKTHVLQVNVLRMPSGQYPLRVGEVIKVLGINSNWYASVIFEKADSSPHGLLYPDADGYGIIIIKRARPYMVGQYKCRIVGYNKVPKSKLISGQLQVHDVQLPLNIEPSFFEICVPYEKPVMPEHLLPPGRVGQIYSADMPVRTAGAGSAAVRYRAVGLPPGLKLLPSGAIAGFPAKGGDFRVRFTAVNALGRSETLTVPVHIDPLPAGVAGDWVAFLSAGWSSYNHVLQFKITPGGVFSGRWHGGAAVTGRVRVDDAGITHLDVKHGTYPKVIRISPGTNMASFYVESKIVSGGGWRNVWRRTTPAKAYEGIHSFWPTIVTSGEDPGFESGETRVTRLGKTHTTTITHEEVAMTSRYILGPQGQILHRLKDEKFKPSSTSLLLPLILAPKADEKGN